MKIKMKGIYKSFGADNVLTNVDFSVSEGETVALLGESGAGKSTLMSILGGAESADKGEITIDGAPLRFRSPADAIKAGIFAVYHDLDPVSDLKVYEYIFLGREISTYGILRNRSMKTETACVLGKIAPEIDPGALLSGLSKVDRRIVGICRAFLSGASVIILDEAMKSLAEEPVQRILKMFLSMGCNGTAVVFVSNNFVSNNMKDPLNICSRFVIMRDGTVAGEYAREHVNADMIRRRLRSDSGISYSKGSRFVSRYCVLKVSSSDCSFYVNRGEVLGITGSGLSELFMPAAGVGKPLSGKIYLHGKAIRVKDPASAIKLGIAFAPRDRRKNGIFPDMNTMDNISMITWRFTSKWGFINRRGQETVFETQAERLRIKSGYRYNPIITVPSGSQQKAVLARLLLFTPQVLIMDSPTQGMSTADREDIYRLIYSLADKGASIIIISDDNSEIVRACDRALIMRRDRATVELTDGRIDEEFIEEINSRA